MEHSMTDNEQDLKINTLENNQTSMAEKLDDIKKTVVDGFKDIRKDINNMRVENDLKYASKRTETIVDRLGWVVVLGVVTAVLTLVIK